MFHDTCGRPDFEFWKTECKGLWDLLGEGGLGAIREYTEPLDTCPFGDESPELSFRLRVRAE